MEVMGAISQLLIGLDDNKISFDSLVGKPINDSNGNKVGVITKVDTINGFWHGTISNNILKVDMSLLEKFFEKED